MGTFIIWLVIVALILLRSARQNKQEKQKMPKIRKAILIQKHIQPKVTRNLPLYPENILNRRNQRKMSLREQNEMSLKIFQKTNFQIRQNFQKMSRRIWILRLRRPLQFRSLTLPGIRPMNSVLADSTTSDETSEDLMRTLDDLMVKGYEPHLTFERDFVAEGMELLNRY